MKVQRLATLLVLPSMLLLVGCEEEAEELEQETETELGVDEQEEVRTEQRTVAYSDWDRNADDALSLDEFESWWNEQGIFDEWSGEENEDLTEERFAERIHTEWDTNDDGVVSESEWQNGVDVWFAGEVEGGNWSDWDADGDSELDANEVAEGLERNGLYDRVDSDDDGVMDDEELGDWFFDIFDTNDDDRIDTSEWDAAKSDVIDG